MLLSTNSFTKAIFTVTGKDVATFLGQWVYQGGHAKFNGSFVFNRKRNTVELEIKQLDTTATGVRRYMGPLAVWVQELDGTFKHNLQIEDNVTKHDITCHSKSRRNKKKKIPLCTGEEVDMNLSAMDQDSPVLWIRIDPDMQLLRQVIFEQPDYQWQYQLRYERDVTAQQQAITEMEKYPTTNTREALMDIVQNEHCYYRVRCEAAMCLRAVANQMAASWSGPPAMMNIFKKLFGSFSCPNIIKLNNFTNFQRYYLQKAMPMAMAGLRSAHGICPTEVIRFLLDLFKYNDNSKNKFSDNYYRSALIEALAETVTPAVSAVLARSFQQTSSEALPSETKLILEEITRYFNLEKLIPCYKHTVTVSCLKAIRRLQKMGHLPGNSAFFKEYAQYGIFVEVRLAAIEALVDITRSEPRKEDLDYLLDLVETDPVPSVKINTLRFLVDNPPFVKKDTNHILNTEDVVERIWKMMNATLTHDTKLRCALVDLYFTLYGRGRPSCLPKPELSLVVNLKERKTISSVADDNSERTSAADLFDQIRDKPEDRKRPASDALQVSSEKRLKTDSTPDRSELFSGDRSRQTSETVHFQPEALASPTVVPSGSVEVAAFVDLSAAPTASTSHEPKEGREKEKKHKDKDRDKEGHSKPHKDKKKKKKKHKHKHKHKHSHGDREKEGKEKSEREERHSSVVSDEASNLSPKSDSN
ncbi:Transcription initiation factor TFIID subunit 2 [Halotydeus destructor]|nr:Transcription initiation factor TFIID subunit 2 [Halotydeus destructor]